MDGLTRCVLILGCCVLAAPQAVAQSPSPRERIEKGDQLIKFGDSLNALDEYQKAGKDAAATKDEKIVASLKSGQSRVVALVKSGKKDEPLFLAASADLRVVIKDGTDQQKSIARNNLAMAYLELDKPSDAIVELNSIDKRFIRENEHFILYYNLGRAYQKANQPQNALREYALAVIKSPAPFTKPGEQAIALVRESWHPSLLPQVETLFDTFAKRRQSTQLRELGLALLKGPASDPKRIDLGFAVLVTAYTQRAQPVELFLETENGTLNELTTAGHGAPVRDLRNIYTRQAFRSKLPELDSSATRSLPWFGQNERDAKTKAACAALLNQLGRQFAGRRNEHEFVEPEEALSRFLLAWQIGASTEAAENTAWILQSARRQLDPQGKLTEAVVAQLFVRKGSLWNLETKTKEDWQNLLRMHMMLGMIFESLEPKRPEAALLQWERAIVAEGQIKDPTFRPAGLYEHLARAQEANMKPADAIKSYLTSAKMYADRGEAKDARRIVGELESGRLKISEDQRLTLRAISQAINSGPG